MRSIYLLFMSVLFLSCLQEEQEVVNAEIDKTFAEKKGSIDREAAIKFLSDGKYGYFLQYDGDDIDRREIEMSYRADVMDDLVEAIVATKASWVIVSMAGFNGAYCSPNATYESIIQDSRGSTSTDIPLLLYDKLSPYGIKIMLRVGIDGPTGT